MAEYLEKVQWAVRPAELVDTPKYEDKLPVYLCEITLDELIDATRRMKPRRAAGPDKHPVDYWKTVLKYDPHGEGASFLVNFCNQVFLSLFCCKSKDLQEYFL